MPTAHKRYWRHAQIQPRTGDYYHVGAIHIGESLDPSRRPRLAQNGWSKT